MTLREIDYRILVCLKCGHEFVFTSDAQEYWVRLGKIEDPQYCRSCHGELRRRRKSVESPR